MKLPISPRLLVLASAALLAFAALAHEDNAESLATIYLVDPTNPQISYDEDPHASGPGVSENPTVIYPESQAGALSGTTDEYTALQPGVHRGDPDTYSLSPASSYGPPDGIPPHTPSNKIVIYLASDSTVQTFAANSYLHGWGQYLSQYFNSNFVRVENHARSGRSSKSFIEEKRLDVILSRIKAGDYLFVMFAVNDSADDTSNRKTNPASTYKAYLRVYAAKAREKGAIPVFVAAQIKCTYNAQGQYTNSVQGYPQAMRELGREIGVAVLDLNRESIDHLTAVGPPEGNRWYATNPSTGAFDYIHLSPYGADKYARLLSRLVPRTKGLETLVPHVLAPARPATLFTARTNY